MMVAIDRLPLIQRPNDELVLSQFHGNISFRSIESKETKK
jgi:hypothetical protein